MMDERVETTFWMDFTIADAFGREAVEDTFLRAFGEWKDDHRYLTELTIVLNHKIWQHWEAGDKRMAGTYDALWKYANGYALEHLEGEELAYFYRVTD